jgi:hypothetical protein
MPEYAKRVAGPRFGRGVELEPILKQIERVHSEAGDDAGTKSSDRLDEWCRKPAHTGTAGLRGPFEGRKGAGHSIVGRGAVCGRGGVKGWPTSHRISIGEGIRLSTEKRRLYGGHNMMAGGKSCVGVTRDVRTGAMTSSRGALAWGRGYRRSHG